MKDRLSTNIMKTASNMPEIIAISYSFVWSIVLLLPGSTFDTSSAYSNMALVANEEIWGFIILFIAFTQLFSMKSGLHSYIRRIGHLLATGLWFSVAAMFLGASHLTTGSTYFIQAFLTGYLYWKEGLNKT